MTAPISFYVAGLPGTKGSARAFVVKGRAIVTNDAGEKAKTWAALVNAAAREAMGDRPPLDGAVRIWISFYLPRPKSHLTARGTLKPTAPQYVASKPDGDKLERCLWDALTAVVFTDDARLVCWGGEKRYANDGRAGARVTIEAVG